MSEIFVWSLFPSRILPTHSPFCICTNSLLNSQPLVNKILGFIVLKKAFACVYHLLTHENCICGSHVIQSSLAMACFILSACFLYCLICFSPSCSLIISITCFDWVSEIICLDFAVLFPLDFMTLLFSWLSCPCKLSVFVSLALFVMCFWQPGEAVELFSLVIARKM